MELGNHPPTLATGTRQRKCSLGEGMGTAGCGSIQACFALGFIGSWNLSNPDSVPKPPGSHIPGWCVEGMGIARMEGGQKEGQLSIPWGHRDTSRRA